MEEYKKLFFFIDLTLMKGFLIIHVAFTKVHIWADINISSCLCYKTVVWYDLTEIRKIGILYTLFPGDCSSIGESTALSRRKLRVRAPSVPTHPINTQITPPFSTNLRKGGRGTKFYSKTKRDPYLLFAFLIKQIWKFPLLQLIMINRRQTYIN